MANGNDDGGLGLPKIDIQGKYYRTFALAATCVGVAFYLGGLLKDINTTLAAHEQSLMVLNVNFGNMSKEVNGMGRQVAVLSDRVNHGLASGASGNGAIP